MTFDIVCLVVGLVLLVPKSNLVRNIGLVLSTYGLLWLLCDGLPSWLPSVPVLLDYLGVFIITVVWFVGVGFKWVWPSNPNNVK